MSEIYGRDLDLNLLRVFVVVAESGSVTEGASRLYLTQPAISAALKRLASALGEPLFARSGRGLMLTARGTRLLAVARPHLDALVTAALAPARFDPRTSDRTVRIGLSDVNEAWLLPALVRALHHEAPNMKLVILPVQFRTVGAQLLTGQVDLAVTIADDLPAGTLRTPLFAGDFVCLFDGQSVKLPRRLTQARYFAHEHVIVSYAGDLRGVVEDQLKMERRVRVSLFSFHGVGSALVGTSLLATVPRFIARHLRALHPSLRTRELPFAMGGDVPMELLWREPSDDDALRYARAHIVRIAAEVTRRSPVRAESERP